MRARRIDVVLLSAVLLLTIAASRPGAHGVARRLDAFVGADHAHRFDFVRPTEQVDPPADVDALVDPIALQEMLEGTRGRRESWDTTPTLVLLTSVLDYEDGDLVSGFAATGHTLTQKDVAEFYTELTSALTELTDGRLSTFRRVVVESPEAGSVVSLFRPGHIVVGRFRGVRAKTGNLGYGGRATRRSGAISGAAVLLDDQADRDVERRRLVRTHELGHALGYNHVTSRPSIMNPLVGSAISEFDRAAIRQAVPQAFGLN
jgi:Matrixin